MAQETVKNLLPKFIQYLTEKRRSPSTILAYKADLGQMVDFCNQKQKLYPETIGQEIIEAFRDSLLADKYTPKTVSRKLNAVKTFFRYLLAENFVVKDPSQLVAHPKIEMSLPKYLSQLQYRALRDVVRNDYRISAIIELILQCGIRISEVAGLKMENVEKDKITLEAYATQPQRTIPLNKRAKDAVDMYLAKERTKTESPYLFVSKNGKLLAVRNIRAAVDRYMKKSEIPGFSVNDLRTTFIVYNIKAGVDLILLSQVSGHKRLSTTERYLELAGVNEPGKKQVLEEL
jgi:site-specific recombinase XerD